MDEIRDRFGAAYRVTRSPLQADGTVIYHVFTAPSSFCMGPRARTRTSRKLASSARSRREHTPASLGVLGLSKNTVMEMVRASGELIADLASHGSY